MNIYVKRYLHRGLIFGGIGPIVLGFVYLFIDISGINVVLSAFDVLKAILTTYIIAFVQAGSSVFHEVEKWSKFKIAFWQGFSIYLVYIVGYLINSWIPFEPIVIIVFTSIFIVVYAVLWITIMAITNKAIKQMNKKIKEINK